MGFGIYLAVLSGLVLSGGIVLLAIRVPPAERRLVPAMVTILLLVTWALTAALVTAQSDLKDCRLAARSNI